MNKKIFENSRFCPKGDTEANWNKAVGFIPLDKEIIIYKKDETHSTARFKVGDGKTVVQDLPFSGTDIEAIEKLIDEKGELLIEYVDNAVAAIEIPQSDWEQNDEKAKDFIKNRPFGIQPVTYTSFNSIFYLELYDINGLQLSPYNWRMIDRIDNIAQLISVSGTMVQQEEMIFNRVPFLYSADQAIATGVVRVAISKKNNYQYLVCRQDDGSIDGSVWVDAVTVTQIKKIEDKFIPDTIARTKSLDIKLDKTGGTIDGNLTITGDLEVSGTATTKDTETIMVKDNIIVTNSDGVELLREAGFAIKTNATEAYGIMYDPVGDGVKIGLGGFDENGDFVYNEGQAQFLATRADNITDGNLPQWDNEKKQFVDSSEKIKDFIKKTDYLKGAGAPTTKTVAPFVGALYLDTTNNSTYQCMAIDEEIPFYTWVKLIKETDYLTTTKAGIVQNSSYYGFRSISDNGVVGGISRTLEQYNGATTYYFISKGTLENIKYDYVMRALSEYQVAEGETSIWTDDSTDESGNVVKGTKTKACETLGTVQKQPNKYNGWIRVYGMTSTGEECVHKVANGIQANTIAIRGANGVIMCGTPSGDNDAVPKKYAEDNFVPKNTTVAGNRIYVSQSQSDGTIVQSTIPYSTGEQRNTIALRDAGGVLYGICTSACGAQALTTKGYVDNLPNNLTLTDEQKAEWLAMLGISIEEWTITLEDGTIEIKKVAIIS